MQVCYWLLAQLGVLELFMGVCIQAGVQLSEAAGIQAWGCLQCTCGMISWNISQSRCKNCRSLSLCVASPFLLIVPVSFGLQLPRSLPVLVLGGLHKVSEGQMLVCSIYITFG